MPKKEWLSLSEAQLNFNRIVLLNAAALSPQNTNMQFSIYQNIQLFPSLTFAAVFVCCGAGIAKVEEANKQHTYNYW